MVFTNVKSVVRAYSKKVMGEKPAGTPKSVGRGHIQIEYPNGTRYHFKFTHERFKTFGKKFDFLDYNGKGASINVEKLDVALENDVDWIVIGYEDGSVYRYPAVKWDEWTRDPPEEMIKPEYRGMEDLNTRRTTKHQQNEETTASIPVSELQEVISAEGKQVIQ